VKVRVLVSLKPEVSDPQGNAILSALGSMGFASVKSVRAGKSFDLDIDETDEARARETIEKIAADVLTHPVVEDFSYEILEGAEA
jgi:phosphoribosylformylglycinamidine synthase